MNISIIVICHHDRGFLQEALNSAYGQDFKGSFEVILQQSEMTMAENTNAAVRRAKGEYIKWLHDDDILLPDCLTQLWRGRGADVIFADAENFGTVNGIYCSELPRDVNHLARFNTIHAATLMYRRQVLIDNPLDESLWTAEEYELNLRLMKKGYKFRYINRTVVRYRVHEAMKSRSAWYSDSGNMDRKQYIQQIKNLYL